jgi:hypothetical protein
MDDLEFMASAVRIWDLKKIREGRRALLFRATGESRQTLPQCV